MRVIAIMQGWFNRQKKIKVITTLTEWNEKIIISIDAETSSDTTEHPFMTQNLNKLETEEKHNI